MFKLKEYYLVAFLIQQAVEKALKALYIVDEKDFPDKTPSLVYLGKELRLPKDLLLILRTINPDFIYTRYPDMDGVSPYEAYDEDMAEKRIEYGDKILKWVSKKIKI